MIRKYFKKSFNGIYPEDLLRASSVLALNIFDLFLHTRFSKAPAFVTWALTERCRLRCKHCSMGFSSEELKHDDRIGVAQKLAKSSLWGVSLIGGEPSLIKELPQYAAILKSHNKYVSVGSSGVGLMPYLDELIRIKVDTIVLSLDSHLEKKHDVFRNRQGTFKEAEDVAEYILGHRGSKKPHLQVRCTINRENYTELAEFIDYWKKKSDGITFQIIQNGRIHQVRESEVLFTKSDVNFLRTEIDKLMRTDASYRNDYIRLIPDYVEDENSLKTKLDFRCLLQPATSLTIMPNGDCRFCYGRPDSLVGNICGSSLKQIWRSEIARSISSRMQSRDFDCFCWENALSPNLELLKIYDKFNSLVGR